MGFGTFAVDACGHVAAINEASALQWMAGRRSRCINDECGRDFDLRRELAVALTGAWRTFASLTPFGGQFRVFETTIPVGEMWTLRLRDHGVPESAEVRDVHVTPQATEDDHSPAVVPMVQLLNSAQLRPLAHELPLFLAPGGEESASEAVCGVLVQFFTRTDSVAEQLLLDAAIAHTMGDFRKAAIDAHTATDTALSRALSGRHPRSFGADSRMSFLDRVAVVSALREEKGVGSLPGELVGDLRELNKARNNVAHPEKQSSVFDEARSAQRLVCALLVVAAASAGFGMPRLPPTRS